MNRFLLLLLVVLVVVPAIGLSALVQTPPVTAVRFAENPLIKLDTSPSIGDNANGPTIIRVPSWIDKPLGRYYMYFAHHSGLFIRLAYADSIRGPWKVYDPGVLKVENSAFYRPQPDPMRNPPGVYTHIASPEIYVDEANKRIVMWTHGVWTEGKRWPDNPTEASAFMRQNNYNQYTQSSVSKDGLNFQSQPAISRQPYLRVFQHDGVFYGIARLGVMLKGTKDPLAEFVSGPSPFRDTRFNNKVRHVTLLPEGNRLHIFFSGIGEAPENILYTTMDLTGDWSTWKIGAISTVLTPEAAYECPNLPTEPSAAGEIDRPVKQLRDPAIFVEGGKTSLFYTFCGEQGIAAAEVKISK